MPHVRSPRRLLAACTDALIRGADWALSGTNEVEAADLVATAANKNPA